MPRIELERFTAAVATAFSAAMLFVFPLQIDRFSNLGITKYTIGFTLVLIFTLFLGACAAIGARPPQGRFAGLKNDPAMQGLVLFVVASVMSTVLSLSPLASLFGLGSYYGGLTLVLYTAVGYLCLRAFSAAEDFDYLMLGIGVTTAIVTVLYVLNIFNIDLIGTYADTAVVERAQFFSTLGQKDFNAAFMAVALPLVFYAFISASGPRRTAVYAVPAVFGALAMAVVDSEGLSLGMGMATLIMVCHRDFDCRKLRRIIFLFASFFLWAAWMEYMRNTVYTQGGTSLLSKFGRAEVAVPGLIICCVLWPVLWFIAKSDAIGKSPVKLWMVARVVAALAIGIVAITFVLANVWPGFPSLGSLDNFLIFNDDWGTYRGTAWRIALGSWADGGPLRWLFGYGPGMMHNAVLQWAGTDITPRMATFYAAHNEYLEQLLSTGIFGLIGWVWFVAASLRRGFRNWGLPDVAPVLLALCSYLTHAFVSIRVSMLFPQVMLLFALLYVLTAPARDDEVQAPAVPAASRRRKQTKKRAEVVPDEGQIRKQRYIRYGKITLAAVLVAWAASGIAPLLFGFLY